ncbi:MAG: murein L,D-transpeptidase [Verrucomicrobiaceae bacterium]|nr:MAG: murein L,D-transpeptidase [Verrucomicrobiaceae bacterium]
MKPPAVLCLLGLVSLASCQEKEAAATTVTEATPMIDYTIPAGPKRAAAAAANTTPGLKRDLAEKKLEFGDPVFIRAFKMERELELFVRNRETGKFDLFRTYHIAGTSGALGPKTAEGDGQVPEGFYYVPPAGMNPASQYHLSFNIGYPNKYDASLGRTGSAIMIHGSDVSIGCLAMTDPKIEEIYTLCSAAHKNGQPYFRVHIFPFRMTQQLIDEKAVFNWKEFWTNLKEGHDLFETHRVPPEVSVENGKYVFK